MLQRRSKQIAVGLPPKRSGPVVLFVHLFIFISDILNRLNPPQPKIAAEGYVEPDARQQMDDARHLAKYVFARQYGLASPFKFQTPKYASLKIPNFNDRENEIKVFFLCSVQRIGTCKTPKRLKEVIPMLEKLLWRHGKCGYKPLRDHACPSKVLIPVYNVRRLHVDLFPLGQSAPAGGYRQ
ncbi:hypothetical protein C8F04DRAFT_961521 [Mycena alexandri]|uniref:Uncharacterized protein n=1 Tax=Mycena alexandri TaxID=1745969 RepID=A0AAD6SNC6_9AGAR|nr:hypothetical protein C8F04DRAFT_961521 [Mycena alexandri]